MKRARLDKFISAQLGINRRDVRALLARGRIKVDGIVASEIHQVVDQFSLVHFDDQVLQAHEPSYILLHKPMGVVSATKDDKNPTVIDLLDERSDDKPFDKHSLHIVGRLDFNTTGLLLLTNDSRWSSRLTEPDRKVSKRYLATLEHPVSVEQQQEYVAAFSAGMFFAFEGITTRPASLEFVSQSQALVRLVEGRYHQIKRMFARFDNKVVALHRFSVGALSLGEDLQPGQSRPLSDHEVATIHQE